MSVMKNLLLMPPEMPERVFYKNTHATSARNEIHRCMHVTPRGRAASRCLAC
jgi:hypothetical protein